MTNIDFDDKDFLTMFMNNPSVKNLLEVSINFFKIKKKVIIINVKDIECFRNVRRYIIQINFHLFSFLWKLFYFEHVYYFKCYDAIVSNNESNNKPENTDNIPLVKSIIKDLEKNSTKGTANQDLNDLLNILTTNKHLKVLIEAHDTIAQRKFNENDEYTDEMLNSQDVDEQMNRTLDNTTNDFLPFYSNPPTDAIRMIGVRKVNDEPLGITVRVNENGDLEIARIMHGGLIDKQGLLHEGDIIKEVNGEIVSTPEELQEKLKIAKGSVTLKVIPSYFDVPLASQVYMKALFSYDPNKDKLIPARDAGLAFEEGDVLQIISQEDIHWWQARLVKTPHRKGIIPSLYLEERRKAFVPHEQDLSTSTCN
jgi:MAGUK p55 subfamily member 2/6